MTIEIYKPEKPLVVDNISPSWIRAVVFLTPESTEISSDRSIILSQENGISCVLKTFQNPNVGHIDTTGKIEIRQDGHTQQIIPLNESNPVYVCAEQIDGKQYAVEQIITYKLSKIK